MTIFESMGNAASEKFHSQFISWIFNIKKDILSDTAKSQFLKSLFKISDPEKFTDFESFTEINKIDILVKTNEAAFVIENKLKSSEHSNQTDRYKIPENYPRNKFGDEYFFLTLIEEDPQNSEWKAIGYQQLLKSLDIIAGNIQDQHKEKIFLKEYQETVRNLCAAFSEFINNDNHMRISNVFTDGDKRKNEKKILDNDIIGYIGKNNLETIFQKGYYRKVMLEIQNKDIQLRNKWKIEESHGNALIHIDIKEIPLGRNTFTLGFQYQNNTYKINCLEKNYRTSRIEKIQEIIPIFKQFIQGNSNHKYVRLNTPHSKAYVSISKTGPLAYKVSFTELINSLSREIVIAKSIIEELSPLLLQT